MFSIDIKDVCFLMSSVCYNIMSHVCKSWTSLQTHSIVTMWGFFCFVFLIFFMFMLFLTVWLVEKFPSYLDERKIRC